jgi:PE family
MSYLVAAPEALESASSNLAALGSSIESARTAVTVGTTNLAAAAADEVSAAITALFNGHGLQFQALSAQASAFHSQFVQLLSASSGSYLATEAASASSLQSVLDAVNGPTEALLGRPLIGNGANGVDGAGQAGGAGGLLWGSGGSGGSGADGTAGNPG